MRAEELPNRVPARFQLEGPVRPLGAAGGFSGARFWQIQEADACWGIRRWPPEHPPVSRLKWIHAVLEHARSHGFPWLPAIRTTSGGEPFIRESGFLWECSRWMPGTPALKQDPSPTRIATALEALAIFHQSLEDFLTGQDQQARSRAPAIESRQAFYQSLVRGKQDEIRARLGESDWADLNQRAGMIVERFRESTGLLEQRLVSAARCQVKLLPCLRDIWSEHVLFVDHEVSSFVDFGAMRIDSVAADIARLLGSVSNAGEEKWQAGLQAYQGVRRLDDEEQELAVALELANRTMSGMQWLNWILLEGRVFEDRQAVIRRLDELLSGGWKA
jgi:homoserine kinase type II